MILSLFSLCAEVTPAVKESQVAIENAFKQILDAEYHFKNFSNEKVFLTEMSTAVAEDSIIVAAAEPAYYKAFKKFIASSFQMKTKPTKTISGLIEFVHPELADDFIEDQATIPVGATPLVTQDGFYSGYGVKAKKQLLIILPLDDRRIDYIINNGLMTFVRDNMDLSALSSDPLSGMEEEKSLPVYQESVRTNESLYDALFIQRIAKKLKSMGLSVSLANTKTVDFIGNISATTVDLSEVIFLSSYTTDKGELTAREYSIALAKGALINSNNNLGAAITKVFSMNDENGVTTYFMYACIADAETANVAKLTAEPGETPPQLIYRAVDELFKMIDVWTETGYALPQDLDAAIIRPTIEKKDPKLGKIKIAVASIMGASAIVSTILSFVISNT